MAGKKYNTSFRQLRQILNLIKDHATFIDVEWRNDRDDVEDPITYYGLNDEERARIAGIDFLDPIRPIYTCTIYTTTADIEYVYNYKYEAVLSMRIESEDPTDPEAIVQDLLEDIAPKGYRLNSKADDDIIIDSGRIVQFIDPNIEDADEFREFIDLDSEEAMKNTLKNYERVTFADGDVGRAVLKNNLGRIEKSIKYNVIRYRYASTDKLAPAAIDDTKFYTCFEMLTK